MHHLTTYSARLDPAREAHAVAYRPDLPEREIHVWEPGHTRRSILAAIRAKARQMGMEAGIKLRVTVTQGETKFTLNIHTTNATTDKV